MLISTFYEELFMSEQNDNTESNFEPGCGIYRCTPPEQPLPSFCNYPNCGGCSCHTSQTE